MDKRKEVELKLNKRGWLIKNIDYVMSEISFQRDNAKFLANKKLILWDLNNEIGEVSLNEITQRS